MIDFFLKSCYGVLASATHILKLEQYREDEHGPCARMTRKFVKWSIFKKKNKKSYYRNWLCGYGGRGIPHQQTTSWKTRKVDAVIQLESRGMKSQSPKASKLGILMSKGRKDGRPSSRRERERIRTFSPFCSIRALSRPDGVCPHCGG